MKKIVYKTETGIAVITPSANYQVKIIDQIIAAVIEPEKIVDGKIVPAKIITPYQEISHMETRSGLDRAMKDIPEGAEYKIIEDSELPKDRVFRNAWNYDLKEDIPKSKEIWKEKLRADRKPILEKLDIDFMRAMEEDDEPLMLDITKAKQILRDITLLVDKASTITGIKKVSV